MKSTMEIVESNVTLHEITEGCERFEAHHGYWPTVQSTEDEFVAAGVLGASGEKIFMHLRTGMGGLHSDPNYIDHERRTSRARLSKPDLSTINVKEHPVDLADAFVKEMLASLTVTCESCISRSSTQSASLGSMSLVVDNTFLYSVADSENRAISEAMMRASVTSRIHIEATDALRDFMSKSGMIYDVGRNSNLSDHYFVKISNEGAMDICYNSILGRRHLCMLEGEIKKAFSDRVNAAFRELRQTASFKENETAIEAALERMGKSQVVTESKAVPALSVGSASPEEEMLLLRASRQEVLLPTTPLRHYAEIKNRLEKAGGRYVTGKQKFVFPTGINVPKLLEDLTAGELVNLKKKYQFFRTSESEARASCLTLGNLMGKRVLEPSAGDGALADVARSNGAHVTTVELWSVNVAALKERGYSPVEADFLDLKPEDLGAPFDAIIANPPFTGGQDIDHFMHMTKFLKEGGDMSVIMSSGWKDGRQKKHREFKDYLDKQFATVEVINAGAFKSAGTNVETVRITLRNFKPALANTIVSEQVSVKERGEEVSRAMHRQRM